MRLKAFNNKLTIVLKDFILYSCQTGDDSMNNSVTGSVVVIGGGISGMLSALDLANSGYYVYLVEKGPSIGGVMAQLDKTFPTNDCAM